MNPTAVSPPTKIKNLNSEPFAMVCSWQFYAKFNHQEPFNLNFTKIIIRFEILLVFFLMKVYLSLSNNS